MKKNSFLYWLIIIVFVGLFGYAEYKDNFEEEPMYKLSDIKDYSGEDIIILNNNEPEFESKYINTSSFEEYYDLDELGRCTGAFGNISVDLMPTESRGDISKIKPTGWHSKVYDNIEDDGHLFNRCHLIAFQLAGENANKKNLITCTKYANSTLMLSYEEKVGNYIRRTKNHVLYRVTPIYDYDNLVAKGIHMEALSIEDNGEGIKFNVFIYNVQPGIEIDYKTGNSKRVK